VAGQLEEARRVSVTDMTSVIAVLPRWWRSRAGSVVSASLRIGESAFTYQNRSPIPVKLAPKMPTGAPLLKAVP
jgi:hypothetical protein